MLSLIYESNFNLALVSLALIVINLACLFGGIFGDPGVKEQTYLHYTKQKYGGKQEVAEDIEMS